MTVKVLHIGKYFPPRYGGIETFMSQLMEEQTKQGLQVSAIVHADKLQSLRGHYIWCNCDIYEVKSYGQLIFVPIAPLFGVKLRKALKEQKPDIIHIHMPNVSAFWCLLFKPLLSRKVKVVVHWHSDVLGADPTKAIKVMYPLYRLFELSMLKQTDMIISTSDAYLNTSEPLKSFRHKSMVVPLGIKLSQDSHSREGANNSGILTLCMIGRLTYYKAHSLVLEALSTINAKQIRIKLNVIGTGDLLRQLQQQTKELHLQDSVVWLGAVNEEQKTKVLLSSDLLLLPSLERTEAFGVVLLEAANYGVPALVTDVQGSGMSSVVLHNETGYVVSSGSATELVEELLKVCSDRRKLVKLGENAKRRLLKHYNIVSVTESIVNLYSQIISDK